MKKHMRTYAPIYVLLYLGILGFSAFSETFSERLQFGLIILFFVSVVTLFLLSIWSASNQMKRRRIDPKHAIETIAIVKATRILGTVRSQAPQMVITLDLVLPDFTTTTVEKTEYLIKLKNTGLQKGEVVCVHYDANDSQKIAFIENFDSTKMQELWIQYKNKDNPYALSYEQIIDYQQHGIVAQAIVQQIEITEETIHGYPVIELFVELRKREDGYASILSRKMIMNDEINAFILVGKVISIRLLPQYQHLFLLELELPYGLQEGV